MSSLIRAPLAAKSADGIKADSSSINNTFNGTDGQCRYACPGNVTYELWDRFQVYGLT